MYHHSPIDLPDSLEPPDQPWTYSTWPSETKKVFNDSSMRQYLFMCILAPLEVEHKYVKSLFLKQKLSLCKTIQRRYTGGYVLVIKCFFLAYPAKTPNVLGWKSNILRSVNVMGCRWQLIPSELQRRWKKMERVSNFGKNKRPEQHQGGGGGTSR